jgi:Beta-propeller repeat
MATPVWLWAKSAGSAGWDYAGLDYGSSTIATNQVGNSYITGRHAGPITKFGAGGPTLSTTLGNVFVAKYNANGICVWAKQFGGNDPDTYGNKGEAIAIDAAGNCYVTGTFHGSAGSTITLGSGVTLTGTGFRQIFVAKFSPAGVPLWARQPTGNNSVNHYAKGIAADFSGNSYITGYLGASGANLAAPPSMASAHTRLSTIPAVWSYGRRWSGAPAT